MSWLVIALILVAAFGPVFWLLPSRRDKRLNTLRTLARQAGLIVDIKPLTRLRLRASERVSAGGALRSATTLVARYSFVAAKPLPHLADWSVIRLTPTSDSKMVAEPAAGDADPGNAEEPPYERPSIEVEGSWRFDPEFDYPPMRGWPESWQVLEPRPESLSNRILGVQLEGRQIGVFWGENDNNIDEISSTLRLWSDQLIELEKRLSAHSDDEKS